jgi:hypothetical protein
LRRRIALLRWLVPLGLLALVVAFELGPSRWLDQVIGDSAHFVVEIAVYGTIGPLLAFLTLSFLGHWLDERETADLQAKILARAREHSATNQQLTDEVLQGLFAVSVLLAATESTQLPAASAETLREAEKTLDSAIRRLRQHLLDHPAAKD